LLRNSLYTENFAPSIRQAVVSGKLVGSAGDGCVASATRGDYAAAAAEVLTGDGHEQRTYELTGLVPWTMHEVAAELSQITGASVVYEDVSSARHLELLLAAGVPAVLAEAQVDTYRGIAAGQLAEPSDDLVRLIGRSETSLHEAVAMIVAESVQRGRRP
jgi:NAD(P)H dehydrogenase (quinone)